MTGDQGQPGRDRCGARGRGTGKPCGLPAGWGTEHVGTGSCRKHFGTSPNHVTNAAERQAKAAAERFGLPIHTTGRQALADELDRSNGLIVYYLAKIQELPPDDLIWGTERRVVTTGTPAAQARWRGTQAGQPSMEVTQSAKPHIYVTLLAAERKHFAAVAAEIQRLGIDARMAQATEQQAMQFKRALDAIFGDLELTPDQRAKIASVVPMRLRELTAVPSGA